MTKEQLVRLSGRELFQKQVKAVKEGKMTFAQLRYTSEIWLRSRGYLPTELGWLKPEELNEMGAVKTQSGQWVFGVEERRRTVGKDGAQTQIYFVPVRANAYFERRRAKNAQFAGLLSATPSPVRKDGTEGKADLVAYAQRLFGGEEV